LKVSSTKESPLVSSKKKKEFLSVQAPTTEELARMMLAAAKYNPKFDVVTTVFRATIQMQRALDWLRVSIFVFIYVITALTNSYHIF